MAIREWTRMQEPNFSRKEIFKLVPKWEKYIHIRGHFGEKW
jgi:hypothetical protein